MTRRMLSCCAVLLLTLLVGSQAFAQYPNCSWGCSANDVNVSEAFVDAPPTCVEGQTITAGLYVVFENGTNTNRYAVRFLGDLYVDGRFERSFDSCVADTMRPGTSSERLATISWTCGESLEFRDVIVSWSANAELCSDPPSCAERKAKCWPGAVIIIGGTPLAVSFNSSSPVCDGEPVSFTDQTNGGETPYSRAWTFGDGTTSSSANPSHTYASPGSYTATLTVTDAGGAVNSHSETILVRDNPTATATNSGPYCPGATIQLSSTGGVTYSWTGPDGFTSSNQNPSIPSASGVHQGIYTVVVTNVYGCSDEASTLVEIDALGPVITVPPNTVVECGASTDPSQTGLATATDDTDPSPTVTYSDVDVFDQCGGLTRTIIRTWTAADACGNTSSGVQTITIVDTTPPTLTITSVTLECDGSGNAAEIADWLASAQGVDVCGLVTIVNDYSGVTGPCLGTGTAVVTFTARDECGNTAQRTVTVTVVDSAPPLPGDDEVTTPEDTAVLIDVLSNDHDICDGTPALVGVGTAAFGSTAPSGGGVLYTPQSNYHGTDTFVYTVEDCSGNQASATVTVIVAPVNDAPVANDQSVTTAEDTDAPITLTASDPDGDLLAYSILSGPGQGTITGFDPSTGQLIYTPNGDYHGADSFTFEACDPSGACDTGLVTITIEPVDDAPVADPQSLTTPEDTPLAIVVTGSDADGDPLTFGIVSGPSNGMISGFDPATGELGYTPGEDFHGTDSFVFEVCDPHPTHGCSQAVVTIVVTPVNDPPVANDDEKTTLEDEPLVVPVVSNDTDPDGNLDPATVIIVGPPANGDVTVDPVSGAVTYTPDPNYNGSDSFVYQVCDTEGLCDSAAVALTVLPDGDPPVAEDDDASTLEDQGVLIDVLDNDSDIDGDIDPTSVTVVTDPVNGTVSVQPVTGEVTYTPDPNFHGTDQFSYRVCDTDGVCDTANVTVTVAPVNDPPVANDQLATAEEDTPLALTVTAADQDGDVLTYAILSGPGQGTITGFDPSTGQLTYTPDQDYHGDDSFTFEACDPLGACDTGVVTITIEPVDDAPIADPQTVTTPEDTSVEITVTGSDVDGDPLTYGVLSGPSSGTISGFDPSTGELIYTPDENFHGADSFVFEVCDPHSAHGCSQATVTIVVTPINDPPVAQDMTRTTSEDSETGFFGLLVSDVDNTSGELTTSILSAPLHGTVTLGAEHTVNYVPGTDFNGTDSFVYQVCDPDGLCDTATVALIVAPESDPPVANDDAATVAEDGSVTVDVPNNDNDPDGDLDRTSVIILAAPSNGTVTVDPVSGTVTYEPDPDFHGTDSFVYDICDSEGACDTATVIITVVPVDDPPVANDDTANVAEDGTVTINVAGNDTDPDGNLDETSVVVIAQPTNGGTAVDPLTGEVTYEPNEDFNGTDTFVYQICDTDGVCDAATVTVTVEPVPDPPVANDDTTSTPEDIAVEVAVTGNDFDVDGNLDPTTVEITGEPSQGAVSVDPVSGDITYTPEPDFFGNDSFTYQVCDTDGLCDTATVTVDVGPTDDPPVANDDSGTVLEDAATTIEVVNNDSDPDGNLDPTSVAIVGPPSHGDANVNPVSGAISYAPDPNYNGDDSFVYQICDTDGECDTAVVSVSVTPVDDPPVANDDNADVAEDGSVTIDVAGNDTDPDGDLDVTSVAVVSGPSNGTVTVDPLTGEVTYEPAPDFNGQDTFAYEICDSLGICDTASVTVNVTPIDDPPVSRDDAANVAEDGSVAINVPGNDTDPDGDLDLASVVILSGPSNGSATVNAATGVVTYQPAPDFNGSDLFIYEICDSQDVCDVATVTVDVTPVDDAPVANDDTATVAEDGSVTIDVPGNDSDPDGNLDRTTVTVISGPTNGTVIVDTFTGVVTYEPNEDFHGTDTFVYQICDTDGVCDIASVTVGVEPVDDPPVANDDSTSTPEDEAVTLTLTANDFDVDGNLDPSTVTVLSDPSHGTVEVNPLSGVVTYTPEPDYFGLDEFTYRVCDTVGLCDTATVSVDVGPTDDPPVANDDNATVAEDDSTTIQVVENDTDPDDNLDPTTVSVVSPPSHGEAVVDPETGAVDYTPDEDYHGPDTFVYQVCDSDGECDTATVTIAVTPVNDPPVANDDGASVAEDGSVVISVPVNDTDLDGDLDPSTVVISDPPDHGTLMIDSVTGAIEYEPDLHFGGTDTFEYQICDSAGVCDVATVTVNVTPVPDPPEANNDLASVPEDGSVVINVPRNDSDPDGDLDVTSVSILSPPSNGLATVDPDSGRVTYLPNPDYNGVDSFTYEICDSLGVCDTAMVRVGVTPINDAPTAACLETVVVDTVVTPIQLAGSDPDGDPLEFSVLGDPGQGTVSQPGEDGTFFYSSRECSEIRVLIAVGEGAGDYFMPINSTVTITPRGGAASLAVTSPPSHGTVEVDDLRGVIRYTPNLDYVGEDSLAYWICDEEADAFSGPISLIFEVCDSEGVCDQCVVQLLVVQAGGGGGDCLYDVVISEVAWPGTESSGDHEWLELRNLSDEAIDLAGWTLRWRLRDPETQEEALWKAVALDGVIGRRQEERPMSFLPAFGGTWWVQWARDRRDDLYVLERATDLALPGLDADQVYDDRLALDRIADLDDRGEVIELIDPFGCVVDTANIDHPERDGWVAGALDPAATMERTNVFDLDLDENWHTNVGAIQAEVDESGASILGTPGRVNSPILWEAVAAEGLQPQVHPVAEPIELTFAGLSDESVDRSLWSVIVTSASSDELLPARWVTEASASGGGVLSVFTDRLDPGEILVWVQMPSGDLLLAPFDLQSP